MKRIWLIPVAGALGWGLLTLPAQAAPASGAPGQLTIAVGENAVVEKVHRRGYRYRHLRRHHHYLHRYHWRQLGVYSGHRWHGRHHRHHRHYRRW
jgi:hypothetical protein